MSRRGWALFLGVSILWGLPYLLIRVAVRQLDPATLVFGRTAVASLILVPFAFHQKAFRSLKGSWGWLALYSVVEIAIPWFFLGSAERHLTSSFACLLVASVPMVAIVLTKIWHPHEPIRRRRIAGLFVGLSGVAVFVGLDFRGGSLLWLGAMAIVIVGYATGPLIISLRLTHAAGLAVVASSVAINAVLFLPWGVLHWPRHLRPETYASVIGLGSFSTAAVFLLFFLLVKEVGPSRSVVVTYFNAVIAVSLGTQILHEPLTTGMLVGFPLIVAGSIFATSSSRVSAASPPTLPLQPASDPGSP